MVKRQPSRIEESTPEVHEKDGANLDPTALSLEEYVDKIREEEFTYADFTKIFEAFISTDRFERHYGVIGLRKILAIEEGPLIQPVIDANLIPRLLEFLKNDNEPILQVLFYIILHKSTLSHPFVARKLLGPYKRRIRVVSSNPINH